MTTIELNNYYPHLTERITLEVSDEIAVTLSIGGRCCDSYKRRKREHGECSLDAVPGFEADVSRPPLTPEEIMERDEDHAALYAAIDRLPPVQARACLRPLHPGAERGPDRQGRGCGGAQRPGGDQQGTAGLKKIFGFFFLRYIRKRRKSA